MSDLQGQPGVLHMTITVKRAATGKEETFELIGTPIPESTEQENQNGCNPLDRSA
jgi:hypothetical protein